MHKSPDSWVRYLSYPDVWSENHCPIIGEEVRRPQEFFTLPFEKKAIQGGNHSRRIEISEVFVYSPEETAIHGREIHGDLGIEAPYGTELVAPCDGIAISSYHSVLDPEHFYRGRQIGYALGLFVQIWVPDARQFIQIGHLCYLKADIPYSLPEVDDSKINCSPTNHQTTIREIMAGSKSYAPIERGDPLGRVGYSGLQLDYKFDFDPRLDRPPYIAKKAVDSWDSPHVHLEVNWLDQTGGRKGWQRCPLGIYGTRKCIWGRAWLPESKTLFFESAQTDFRFMLI